MKYLTTLLLFYALTCFGNNVTNGWIGQQLYIGMPLTFVPSSGGGGSTNADIATLTTYSRSDYYFYVNADREGYFAVQDTGNNITIWNDEDDPWASGTNAFIKVWSCAGATDSTISGHVTYLMSDGYDGGSLTSINVTNCTQLAWLGVPINGDNLHSIIVMGLTSLTNLYCNSCGALTNLNVTGCTNLTYVDSSSGNLSQSVVDAVLSELVTNGAHNGTCDVDNNNPASSAGLASKAILVSRGWVVYND